MDFEHIILEEEQKELFIEIVEGFKSAPRENRSPMIEANTKDGTCLVMPGSANLKGFAWEDPDTLANAGLLQLSFNSRGGKIYTVSPIGFKYYEWFMKQQGKPVERIEGNIRNYLDLNDFKHTYIDAYNKLKLAEEKLWASDSQEHFTTIGHLCREAMQDFADRLYILVFDQPSTDPKNQTIKRIREIIRKMDTKKGKTVKPFLDALVVYWGTLSDLVQRQEHGAEREKGEELSWEDARRVVFQTINVMVELQRTLGK